MTDARKFREPQRRRIFAFHSLLFALCSSSLFALESTPINPSLATDGAGHWIVAWQSADPLGGTIGADLDILLARSDDDGVSWSAPRPLNANAASDTGDDFNPQVTTDGSGTWLAIWVSRDPLGDTIGSDLDVVVSRSTDNGLTWSPPGIVGPYAEGDTLTDMNPRLAASGSGQWLAVWEIFGAIGSDADIMASRSTDDGRSWTPVPLLNTNAGEDSGGDFTPQAVATAPGELLAVWWSDDPLGRAIGTDFDLLVSRSADQGLTWSAPVEMHAAASNDLGDDRFPRLAIDGSAGVLVVWESFNDLKGSIGVDLDILISRSSDRGLTWSPARPLNSNADADTGEDRMPAIASGGDGDFIVVWESSDPLGATIGDDLDILVARSSDSSLTWTDPVPLDPGARSDDAEDFSPQIASGGATWIVLWESQQKDSTSSSPDSRAGSGPDAGPGSRPGFGPSLGGNPAILISRSVDGGLTWLAPARINTPAAD